MEPVNRRRMLRDIAVGLTGTYALVGNPAALLSRPERRVVVPCLDGEQTIIINPGCRSLLQSEAVAQGYLYAHLDDPHAACEQMWQEMHQVQLRYVALEQQRDAYLQELEALRSWMEYQRAVNFYQRQWQMHIAHRQWVTEQKLAVLKQSLKSYRGRWEVGQLTFMDHISSIYGFAKRLSRRYSPLADLALIGVSALGRRVGILKTVPALISIWNAMGRLLSASDDEKQECSLPQSSEEPVRISLPDDMVLDGMGFKTKGGMLAMSGKRVLHEESGKEGYLAKVKVRGDDKFMVI